MTHTKATAVRNVIVIVMIAVCLFCLAMVFYSPRASSHDWYGKTSDPVFQSNCCGGHDCAPVDPAWVFEIQQGYRLIMTVPQAQTVNPTTKTAVDAIIPWSRVQSPPKADHEFYACIYDTDRFPPRRGVICFFATPTM